MALRRAVEIGNIASERSGRCGGVGRGARGGGVGSGRAMGRGGGGGRGGRSGRGGGVGRGGNSDGFGRGGGSADCCITYAATTHNGYEPGSRRPTSSDAGAGATLCRLESSNSPVTQRHVVSGVRRVWGIIIHLNLPHILLLIAPLLSWPR